MHLEIISGAACARRCSAARGKKGHRLSGAQVREETPQMGESARQHIGSGTRRLPSCAATAMASNAGRPLRAGHFFAKNKPRESGAKSREESPQERDGSRLADSHARNGCGNATVNGICCGHDQAADFSNARSRGPNGRTVSAFSDRFWPYGTAIRGWDGPGDRTIPSRDKRPHRRAWPRGSHPGRPSVGCRATDPSLRPLALRPRLPQYSRIRA
jgi:hypothetical protein